MATQGGDLVALYDKAPLNARYWVSIGLAGKNVEPTPKAKDAISMGRSICSVFGNGDR